MNRMICLAGLAAAVPLAVWAFPASAQDIYKCVVAGHVAYTDQPCAAGKGELLHRADAAETIDHYLRMGQPQLAEAWAKARHLDSLYAARLALYRDTQATKAAQAERDAATAQAAAAQAREDQQQRMLAAQIAAQNAQADALQAENTQLQAQNAAYQNALTQQPAYYMAGPTYFGGWNAGRYPPYDHQHEHRPPPTAHRPPPVQGYTVLQACGSLKGGGGTRC